ncbi:MAG: hypothetical protein Q8K81_06605 [Sulfuricurvum sp.]|nr:hypothetical protein [Sulfuricurvum sp.]
MRRLALWCALAVTVTASIIPPYAAIQTDGLVSDMVVREGKLYVSTDGGGVGIYDAQTRKKVSSILLPKVKIGSSKPFVPKIYSVDHYRNMTVMVSESGESFRNVFLMKENKLVKIIDNSRGLLIKKVRFLDAGHVLFGLSGDTIVSMDISTNTLVYQVQAGGGVFQDMALSNSRGLVAVADESGEVAMINTKNGRKVKTLRGINLDNINRIDYRDNTILSAGQDRRVGVYREKGSYFIETDFFVYAVGLSPSATRGVYTDGSENELQVFDVATRAKTARLKGGETLYDTLIFINEHQLIGAGEENKIYYWRIP